MIKKFPNYRFIIAGVSHIDKEFYEKILVCASDGTFASDILPLVRANVTVIIEKNGIQSAQAMEANTTEEATQAVLKTLELEL